MSQPHLIKLEFFDSLQLGTGKAYLIANKYQNKIDFSEEIIKACVKNYAYDGQCEESRADYLVGLINLCERKEDIKKLVLRALSKKQKDTWTLVQLFKLAKLFVDEGNEQALKTICDRYLKYPFESAAPWAGYEQILQLRGFDGLLFVAEKEGKLLEKEEEYWVDGSVIQEFQNANPRIRVKLRLRNAAKTNYYIKLYLQKIEETECERAKFRRIGAPKRYTYNHIKKKINNNSFYLITEEKANELSDKEVRKLADELLLEKENQKIEQYLRFFGKRKFPYDYTTLLNFAKGKDVKDTNIKYFSAMALKYFTNENVRRLTIKNFQQKKQI